MSDSQHEANIQALEALGLGREIAVLSLKVRRLVPRRGEGLLHPRAIQPLVSLAHTVLHLAFRKVKAMYPGQPISVRIC